MIRFKCKNCGQKIKVPQVHAGKKGKCPKCSVVLTIPDLNPPDTTPGYLRSGETGKSGIDSVLLDMSQERPAKDKDIDVVDKHTIDTKQEEVASERKFPWIIDIFLYPLSAPCLVNMGFFLFVPIIINLLQNHVFAFFGRYGGIFTLILYLFFYGYMIYYFAECLRDSAKGGFRAPDVSIAAAPDKEELLSQFLYLLGSAAICFWPTAVYYIFTENTDIFFWVLLSIGGFFFPMTILAVFMFGTISCLNPLLIIASVKDTFIPYFGMVLIFYSLFGIIAAIKKFMPHFAFSVYIYRFICIYTIMIMTHILGRFFYRHQEKLYWEV